MRQKVLSDSYNLTPISKKTQKKKEESLYFEEDYEDDADLEKEIDEEDIYAELSN